MADAAPKYEGMCIVVTQEGEEVEVKKSVIAMSQIAALMLSEEDDDGDSLPKLPMPYVKRAIFDKIMEFCEHHEKEPMPEIEKPLKSTNMAQVVSDWDAKFVDLDQPMLFELILAANFMDIRSLLDVCCAKVASMIKGKTPEDIRKTFNIVDDFTDAERQAVNEENRWCDESSKRGGLLGDERHQLGTNAAATAAEVHRGVERVAGDEEADAGDEEAHEETRN
eukprot:CAMPEP_0181336652 /NCGR_PEP_ID=MMETSP1101-20121128/27545_1 /TAXON_ID=46948 /ORGANISM="Rhodomonas abbreviata, Strain Caron Lab Isolate" /LENGTH=222 /DNA_ID=CAMNT_0023446985 /DNA_START=43 /DNA_END=708 /DNA_ORIENTATION=+